nr:CHAT domain-containing protein [Coleofasciculus sp. FACHB-1120]
MAEAGEANADWLQSFAGQLGGGIQGLSQLNQQVIQLYHRGEYAEAAIIAQQSLELARQILGAEHPQVAGSLNNLAELYRTQGRFSEAEPLYLEGLAMSKRLLGAEHPDVATSLNNLAILYQLQGRFSEAERLYLEALAMSKRLLGVEHPNVAQSLNNLAALYNSQGRFSEAERFLVEALAMRQRLLGAEHPDVATSLNNLAELYLTQGRFSEAEPLYVEALAMYKRLLGVEHPDVATSLNNLAGFYQSQGRFSEAEPLYVEALAMRQRFLGAEHPDVATSLNNLAALYRTQGRFSEAERFLVEALAMKQRLLGAEHPGVAISLNNLAALYNSQGRFSEAEPLLVEALVMSKHLLGAEHPDVATSLNNLAELYQLQGRFSEAEPLYLEALAMKQRLLGAEHPDVAISLNNLAELYRTQGRFSEAEPLLIEALMMSKCLLGAEHTQVATSLNNLAILYQLQGRFSEAEPLCLEALAMSKRLLGKEHPDVSGSLNNLAALYKSQGRLSEAERFLVEALAMKQRLLGAEHPDVAISLNNLAELYRTQGRFSEAEQLYLEALAMNQRLLGVEHPDVARSLNNLALLYCSQGRFSEAEPLYLEALPMWKRLLGVEHPDVAGSLNNLAALLAATNRFTEALALMRQASQIEDSMISQIFAASSESDRLAYLETIRGNLNGFLSLVHRHLSDSGEAKQAALDLVLKRKVLTATALATFNSAVYSGRYPHLATQFQQWQSFLAEELHLIYSPPLPNPEIPPEAFRAQQAAYQQRLTQLKAECKKLEKLLASQVPEIQLQQELQTANCRAVALELPAGSTLVEFVRFDVYDSQAILARGDARWQPARYLAFVLPAQQPNSVEMIDLGEAEHIDGLIQVFRSSVSVSSDTLDHGYWEDDDETFLKYDCDHTSAIALRQAVFDKISTVLSDSKYLLLSPDGGLNLVPFQILPSDGTGKQLLMDNYTISYFTVGRDILRSKVQPTRPASPPLIIADPKFNWAGELETKILPQESQKVKSLSILSDYPFRPAPGTRFLGEAVAQKLRVKTYMQEEALESLLTNQSPRILLIATHGYFSGEKDYLNLIQKLLNSPNGEELKILQKNPKLLDRELLALMEEISTKLAENGNQNTADWLRNFAVQVTERVDNSQASSSQNCDRLATTKVENPMLRSGLALAGANIWINGGNLPPEAGKGLLFAQDVTGLDLWANEVTVLSACNTAIGDIKIGEGVFGLRRAFAVAGSKTLVMSLWPVPDKVTALLMQRFFDNLQCGLGRADALQEAQNYIRTITVKELRLSELGVEVLSELLCPEKLPPQTSISCQEEDRLLEHPFFWGAWVCQGDTTALASATLLT